MGNQAIKAAEDASVEAQQSADSARKHVEKATKEVQSWKEIKTLLDNFANEAAKTVNELTAKIHEESGDEMITEPVKKELSKEEFIDVMLNDLVAIDYFYLEETKEKRKEYETMSLDRLKQVYREYKEEYVDDILDEKYRDKYPPQVPPKEYIETLFKMSLVELKALEDSLSD